MTDHPSGANESTCLRELGRLELGIPAKLMLVNGEAPCLLVDFSLEGAKVATDQALRGGEDAMVKIVGESVFGTVVWAKGGLAGIAFDERTSKELLLSLKAISANYDLYAARQAAAQWADGTL